ncbi:hypothetical protein GCM10027347_12090 [Larkinella harenae]
MTGNTTVTAMRAQLSSLEGEWKLINYRNKLLPEKQRNTVTLILANRAGDSLQVSGRSFVNNYGGILKIDDQNGLSVLKNSLFTTEMAGPPEAMNAELEYYRNLPKAKYFAFTDAGNLVFYLGDKNNKDTELMLFARK